MTAPAGRAPATRPRSTHPIPSPRPIMRTLRAASAAVLVAALAVTGPAGAQPVTTLTFDGVPSTAGAGAFLTASGYQFTNFATLEATSTFGTGSNAVGGTGRFAYVTLQPGLPDAFGSIRRDDINFDLLDAFVSFRRFDDLASPVTITVNAYRGFDPAAAPVFTQTLTLTNSAQLFAFNFRDVSEVEFLTAPLQTGRSAVLALDNVRVGVVVPEPTTVALLGAGVLALLGAQAVRRGQDT